MEKEFAQNIWVKKFTNQYGEWISVNIKEGNNYRSFKFYPKKEQKSDKYIDFYGVVDDWKPAEQRKAEEENIVKFNENIGDEEIPF